MRDEIVKRMNRTEKGVEQIMSSIERKIRYYNGLYNREDLPVNGKGDNTAFNIDENRLISVIDYCDKYINKEAKDHFPPYMSDHDIMKTIKEAYDNAEKVEERSYGKTRVSSPKGTMLFQGTSDKGLTIQFYYDFDNDEISTAYPVFIDTINRPDLRHPGNKNKKRQNQEEYK